MASKHGIKIICLRHPPSKTKAIVPIGSNSGAIIKSEPTPPGGPSSIGIDGDYFKKHLIAQAQQEIVRPHLGVLASCRHIDAQPLADIVRADFQGWRDDCEMIEFQHLSYL